jgi:hypothetical protein
MHDYVAHHFQEPSFHYRPMSAGTRKFELGSLFRANRSEPPMPVHTEASEKAGSERLRIARFDEPEFLNGKALDEAAKSSRSPHRPSSKCLAKEPAVAEEAKWKTVVPNEPGVDLEELHPHDIDANQLAAIIHAIPALKKGETPIASTGKDIVMPLANTDLLEIFEADKVCMVARPHHNAPTLEIETESKHEQSTRAVDLSGATAGVSGSVENTGGQANRVTCQFPSAGAQDPPTISSPVPPPKASHHLDRTQQYLVENWPKLPPNVQAAILNVIDAATDAEDD